MQRVPPELTDAARRLRRDMTEEEHRLWSVLKTCRPRFTRQLVIDRFIVDFACRTARIVIELDGGHHALPAEAEADADRTAHIERHGWTVLRFWNNDVRENLDGVVLTILAAVERASTRPRPLPFREGRNAS